MRALLKALGLHFARTALTDEIEMRASTSAIDAGEYQQEPIPLAGNITKAEWFKEYDVAPTRGYADLLVSALIPR